MGEKKLIVLVIAILSLSPVIGAKSAEEKLDVIVDDGFGTANASCPLGAGTTPLSNGVTVTSSLPATTGASCEFSFAMSSDPITSSKVELFGLAADYDLYVKRGSPPTTSSFDCRPFSGGLTSETCTLTNSPAGSTVFIMVRRFSGSGAFSIRASEIVPPPTCSLGHGVHALSGSVTASLTSDSGANCMFKFTPDAAADIASFVMTLTTSDFDLYVKKGAAPTTSSYDCRPFSGGTATEQCDVFLTDSTDIYAMVRRFSGSGSFTLTGSNVIIPVLANGQPVSGSVNAGQNVYWKVVMPATNDVGNPTSALAVVLAGDESDLACRSDQGVGACATAESADAAACTEIDALNPGTCSQAGLPGKQIARTDADLYVRHAALPTTSSFHCRGYNYGTVESCAFSTDGASNIAAARTEYNAQRAALCATDPALCNVPSFPALPGQVNVVPFHGEGKYFIAVRGFSAGASEYNLVAAWG